MLVLEGKKQRVLMVKIFMGKKTMCVDGEWLVSETATVIHSYYDTH